MKEKLIQFYIRNHIKISIVLVLVGLMIGYCTAWVTDTNAADTTYGHFYSAKLVSVYDGDTIYVNIPNVHPLFGENVPIRLRGLDTPEIRGAGCPQEKELAYEARDYLIHMLQGSIVLDLYDVGRDSFFRIDADVYVERNSINDLLLAAGYAVPYDGKKKTFNWCARKDIVAHLKAEYKKFIFDTADPLVEMK